MWIWGRFRKHRWPNYAHLQRGSSWIRKCHFSFSRSLECCTFSKLVVFVEPMVGKRLPLVQQMARICDVCVPRRTSTEVMKAAVQYLYPCIRWEFLLARTLCYKKPDVQRVVVATQCKWWYTRCPSTYESGCGTISNRQAHSRLKWADKANCYWIDSSNCWLGSRRCESFVLSKNSSRLQSCVADKNWVGIALSNSSKSLFKDRRQPPVWLR